MTASITKTTYSVYVGTYKKYSNGSLFGREIKLNGIENKADFISRCKEIHKDETDPEFMFQNWEGIPPFFISECSLDETFFQFMEDVEDFKSIDLDAFNTYLTLFLDYGEEYTAETVDNFRSAYHGHFSGDAEVDFTHQYVENNAILKDVPEHLQDFFDYQMYSRNL